MMIATRGWMKTVTLRLFIRLEAAMRALDIKLAATTVQNSLRSFCTAVLRKVFPRLELARKIVSRMSLFLFLPTHDAGGKIQPEIVGHWP
jgi:hypothetical protein